MIKCLLGSCPTGSVVSSIVAAPNAMPAPSTIALMTQGVSLAGSPPIVANSTNPDRSR